MAVPELPEVETVRRSLTPVLVGRTVRRVLLHRPEVVTGSRLPTDLLEGRTVRAVERRGKQLLILSDDVAAASPCLCVHLGMTGSLRFAPVGVDLHSSMSHVHVTWELDDGVTIGFRDPRRFGGVWTFPTPRAVLENHWRRLGTDALTITPTDLHACLQGTTRGLKATLLDQSVLAGLGNIYVDELLFSRGLHPLTCARKLNLEAVRQLVTAMRHLLKRAIRAGGSTVRDYVNGQGADGWFQISHRVYGRAGAPCRSCAAPLRRLVVGGRTTVFCRACQPRSFRKFPSVTKGSF